MEINEVRLGDKVTFKHKNKVVTGKVIYRHQDKDKAALMGHVNVQILGDAPSYPVTLHVSKLKPALKEEFHMENIHESLTNLVDNIDSGNHVDAEEIFGALLQQKIDELLDMAKLEVAQDLFNTSNCADCEEDVTEAKKMKHGKGAEKDEEEEDEEDLDEALKGKQHKIDANKNGKIDAQDFKMLRAKKGMKEEAESLDEISASTLMSAGKKRLRQAHDLVKKDDNNHKAALKIAAKGDALKKYAAKKASTLKKEEVEVAEAYSDPYAAKKAAEMKKAHAATMADAKKEFEATKKTKFAKNFMKMKKEEVEQVDEGNAKNKAKKNAVLDARGTAKVKTFSGSIGSHLASSSDNASKGIRRGWGKSGGDDPLEKSSSASKERDKYTGRGNSKLNAIKSQKKPNLPEEVEQMDEVITKKTPTGEVISDFVHSKNPKFAGKSKKERIRMALGAKYSMMRKGK